MGHKPVRVMVWVVTVFAAAGAIAGPSSITQLDTYRQLGIEQVDVDRGRQLWNASINERGCTTCHGEKPVDDGMHVKTVKTIKPMAPSVNPVRFQSAKKIEKWFLRNCKWTLGRECSLQEKADILSWLASQ